MGDKIVYDKYVNECAPGTYSSLKKRVFMNECSMCPEGYECDDYAITNLTLRECPGGHYCGAGTKQASKCPPGYFFDGRGATIVEDCIKCTAGSYCPEGSSEPIKCTGGHFCLAAAVTQITCPGGFYCNADTNF